MQSTLHNSALLQSRPPAAELDLVYPRSAPEGTSLWNRFRQWLYNYVLPVVAILALPLLILPLVATFIFACARMHHDEPDSELYGSTPINGPVTLEDPQENLPETQKPSPGKALASADSASAYHWN